MTAATDITFDQIRERAREIWERNHRPDGLDIAFWLLAERELKAEAARAVAAPTESGTDDGPDRRGGS
ncbi:DUF2934 domain-containing protein [uncultured Methylobacterium sp.]|uniref:DUF2934 domain-containing protein n=1 Tax=uncultured Methylobacterium sp. TaxID=157278 RepID=UPI0035CB4D0D